VIAAACIAVLALLPAEHAAQGCRRCEDRGVTECKRCAKDACRSERPFVFCSIRGACTECGGAGLVECDRCDAEPQSDLAALQAEVVTWKERFAPLDAFMGRELRHAATQRFEITFDIEKIDAGKPHAAMHVYLDRLEALGETFRRDLGATDADFSAPTRVLLWSNAANQAKASLEYTRQPSSTESKLMGAAPIVSIHYDKSHLHEEFELHQAVVHQVAHCLLSNVWDGVWPGNIKGGWIDEGLAHGYETSLFGGVRHYCYVENDTLMDFEFGRWESEVRRGVDSGKALGVLAVTGRNTVEMTPVERMYAWALVDYLLRAKPGTLGPIARDLKQKRPFAESIAERLALTPFELDAAWQEWIRATYSPQKKPR
jgi:hypothetical protein